MEKQDLSFIELLRLRLQEQLMYWTISIAKDYMEHQDFLICTNRLSYYIYIEFKENSVIVSDLNREIRVFDLGEPGCDVVSGICMILSAHVS